MLAVRRRLAGAQILPRRRTHLAHFTSASLAQLCSRRLLVKSRPFAFASTLFFSQSRKMGDITHATIKGEFLLTLSDPCPSTPP